MKYNNIPDGYVTLAEAAVARGVHRQTVRGWARAGKIPSVSHGGKLYVDKAALLAYQPPRAGCPVGNLRAIKRAVLSRAMRMLAKSPRPTVTSVAEKLGVSYKLLCYHIGKAKKNAHQKA